MSYYVPLPAYNPGPGINLEPVNAALDGILQQRNTDRQFALQQKASDRADQQFALDKRNSDLTANAALARQSAGIAQAVLAENDPTKKAAMMAQLYGLHPEYRDRLVQHGIDPNDYDGTANFIVSEARGYVDPQAVALRNAQIEEARANVTKSNAEIAAMRRQANLVNSLLSPDDIGVSSSGSPAIMPAASSTYGGPANPVMNALSPPTQGNAFATGGAPNIPAIKDRPSGPTVGGTPVNALAIPQPVRDVSTPSYTRPTPVDNRTQGVNAPSTSLPNPGDPTSFAGGSSAGMTTPSRISADTKRAIAWDLAMNNGKGVASILNNDPGSKYATTFATKTAEDNAAINLKQKMTQPMLDIVHGMREKLTAAGDDIADMATGPNYGQLSDDPSALESVFKAPLPDTSGEFYQNARAGVRNIANNTLGFIPGVGQFTQPLADSGNKARDLNLELHHLVKGIGAGVKSIPGTKGGGASTDADQALVLDAVGEAMHSANATTRNNILFDAENILRARAGLPRLAAPQGYQPSYLATKYGSDGAPAADGGASPTSGQSSAAQAIAGARDAISKGANPAAVRARLIQNGINPDGL